MCLMFLPLGGFALVIASLAQLISAVKNEYDYIVIGSGPGGGPLAANLARANYTVLLLEGGDQSTGAAGNNQYPPQITWDFFVKHYDDEERTLKHNLLTWRLKDGGYWVGNKNVPAGAKMLGIYYPRGATVGGSSMINAQVTFLPSESDWNFIAEVTGDKSWSHANMIEIFRRIEHNNYLPRGTPGHGFDGYFHVGLPKPTSIQEPGLSVMQAVASSLSLDPSKVLQMVSNDSNFLDPTRDKQEGIWGLPSHIKPDGQRFSSREYISDTIAAGFPLTLSMNSLATKILFGKPTARGSNPRATGVAYLEGKSIYSADSRFTTSNKGVPKIAIAKREVIISGGTFNSPQILMLSGIGPAKQLKKFNIPVLVDSPGVGNNMQDNQEVPVVGITQQIGSGGPGGCVLIKTKHAVYDERDMIMFQGPFVFRGFWPSNQSNTELPTNKPGTYGIATVKIHPQNRLGTVELLSNDPQDMPEIHFNLFKEGRKTDIGAMKDTIAWARRVHASVKAPVGPITTTEPPCKGKPDTNGSCGEDDEDWIIGQTFGHHPTSTCAIGGDDDSNAVLDSRFRVRGVEGLRVCIARPGILDLENLVQPFRPFRQT
ncbi:related to choline dehydrogenase [Rhynchosporium secalis]|uniref:Related to choline dehydrogenase n=1 Tax=Rhynchosporium secalis TaxID=38038 RepID=A0A1E1M3Y2_RHYSE|nr:related to choline dehydrogenase [Rhynchosporium secalis]